MATIWCVCQMMMDSNISTVFKKSKYTAKDMGTLRFDDSDVKKLLLLKREIRVGVDQTGQHLDIELDLRHAPLIIIESGCDTNTKAVSQPREKMKDRLVLEGRRSPILNRDDATRYKSVYMRLHTWPRTNWVWLKQRNIWSRE